MGPEAGGRGSTKEEKKKKEKEEEKIPHMCESMGHRPLGAAAQKGLCTQQRQSRTGGQER